VPTCRVKSKEKEALAGMDLGSDKKEKKEKKEKSKKKCVMPGC
jgi:hypothetical protein